MSCRQAAPVLDVFLDGELPQEQMLEVEAHLAACDACRERAGLESAIRVSLQRLASTEGAPSAAFEARLAGALRAERERLLVPSSAPPRSARRWPATLPLLLAAAATFSVVAWLNNRVERGRTPVADASIAALARNQASVTENPEQVLDDLVSYHAAPPTPQITEQRLVERLEPEVGVPVRLPALNQYGASWEGGSVIPMRNQRAAIFRYRLSNHPVTVYVYDARRVPLRGVLEPRVVHNQAVSVGERRGYSIAAREQRGVGYAVATDLNDEESAELVTAIY